MSAPGQGDVPGGLGGAVVHASRALALAGGALMVGLIFLAVASVVGRLVGAPIPGDFELVQFGCAVAVAMFLPYGQLARANIIVDFFTARAAKRTRGMLDAAGAVVLGLVMALLAWRTAVGALDLRASHETTMITSVPIWWAYALMCPAFALTALTALYTARESWNGQ
jgi:TRAP-type C4-dicarboxylate transport system permease small subunit